MLHLTATDSATLFHNWLEFRHVALSIRPPLDAIAWGCASVSDFERLATHDNIFQAVQLPTLDDGQSPAPHLPSPQWLLNQLTPGRHATGRGGSFSDAL